ncbi:PREDICTED: uncharacterized protein LOC107348675 [Acropora digitifera]|uniref:uncharacterized protein LOC107348675 n=1 Tax=Acropora digitifera TaxID=70779 RepID=UPI00077AD4A7|nr:PREDICTED: uncharacterized protein LOC107348675 [Acropora digitifera]
MGSRDLLKEHQHRVPGEEAHDGSHASVDGEGIPANSTNLRTLNGAVIAVLESEDEDDEGVIIRPAKKAIPFRKRALSSPCSQAEFKRPVNPGQQQKNPRCVLSSESDEDFEDGKSDVHSRSESAKVPQEKYLQAKKEKSLSICAKKGSRRSFDSRGKMLLLRPTVPS